MLKIKAVYPDIEADSSEQSSPLAFQQERVLYLNKLAAESPLWNRISCKRLLGEIDVQAMKKAVIRLTERHSVLRTRISLADGEPRQSKHEVLIGAFRYLDLSADEPPAAEERARTILNREYEQPFSLQGGELFKATLVRCSSGEYLLILKLHHIISDATTFRILWHDLKALYNSCLGAGEPLQPLELAYSDYARWVRKQFSEENTKDQESYWLQLFSGELPRLDLPTDFPAPMNVTFNGALERQALPQEMVKRLQSFSLERRVIPFSTLLSAYLLLLHRYCRQDDIVVGTVFSGRHYSPKIKPLAGFFSTTVALRARIDVEQSIDDFVRSVHSQITDAYAMQDYPFERLVDRLDPERGHRRNPLFRALFNVVAEGSERETFEGIRSEEWVHPPISATQVDLFLDVRLRAGEAELRIEYNTDVLSRTTIQRMLRHYLILLEGILSGPTARVEELSMLDAAERDLVLALGTGERQPAPARNVVELLEERAARTPERPALLFEGGSITCGAFNRRVNQLAAALVAAGVGEGDVVAIMLERSLEMVLGLFAILKTGAAYLPIDPAFPQERIDYILRDSAAECLLVASGSGPADRAEDGSPALRRIALDAQDSYVGEGDDPGRPVGSASPAYLIYTSGSTGKPKGVVVEHGALMNTLGFLEKAFPLGGKTILLKTSFTFDVSCTELFGWLFDGRLALLREGAESDARGLLEAIDSYAVTHVNFVPSMLDAFLSVLRPHDLAKLEGLEYVFVAGEALSPDLVNRFYARLPRVRLENLYGPTEAAIYATWHSLPRGETTCQVPIGRPISNTRSYILDRRLQLLPMGVTGELYLSGPGLAREYLNEPELTNDRFCPNPYWEGERLYRTGDLARWGGNGAIHFLGRADGQVKVRGFRVELGEVEQKLRSCRAVSEGVVTAITDQFGERGLVAYFTSEDAGDGSVETIRGEMAGWLPGYMVPDHFVKLERLPRLPSGKVDLRALPKPGGEAAATPQPAGGATELERIVIEIAENILNTKGLGPDSNFFRLGGNSLLTLRFIAALDQALGTSLSGMDFLALPTMAEIAKMVEPSVTASRRAPEAVLAGAPAIAGARPPTPCSLEGGRP
jgi:amino acid adenylation domain-containing protein